jgi:hypothetical protein
VARVRAGDVRQDPSVGQPEAKLARRSGAFERIAALMHEPVVKAAQVHQVCELGGTAVRPVVDVMRVQEAPLRTAREPAAPVAAEKRAPQRGRHAAGAAADRQGPPVALEDPHDARVTREPPRGLRVEQRPVVELAGALADGVEPPRRHLSGIDVHDHLIAVAARSRGRPRRQQRVGHQHQCAGIRGGRALAGGADRLLRWSFGGNISTFARGLLVRLGDRAGKRVRAQAVAARFEGLQDQRTLLGGKPAAEQERAVLIVLADQIPVTMGDVGRGELPCDHAAVGAQGPLQLSCCGVTGELQQGGFELRGRHPGQSSHL